MERDKKTLKSDAPKKLWALVKPWLSVIMIVVAVIVAVIILTYIYFTCTKGSIPADRIIDENAIKKSDWLIFWGSVLAVVCTLSLALVSFKQNKDLNKINDDREKKDTFFAKLRFAAEFYSLIEFTLVKIKEESKNLTLTFNIKDAGKVPPNKIRFSKIELKPIDMIDQVLKPMAIQIQPFLILDVEADIKSTPVIANGSDEIPWRSICLVIDVFQYENLKRMYAEIFELGRKNQQIDFWGKPAFKLVLSYTLGNPLDVKTNVVSEFLLGTDFSMYSPNDKKNFYKFTIKEKLDVKITYDFTREIK